MQTEESRELVKRVWATFSTQDEGKIADLFENDAEWVAPRSNATAVALGVTDHMKGSADIASFIVKRAPVLYRNIALKFTGIYADGPTVVVEQEMSATLPNGLPYRLNYCFVFECRNGRVARMREYMDTMSGHHQVFAGGHPLAANLPLSQAI